MHLIDSKVTHPHLVLVVPHVDDAAEIKELGDMLGAMRRGNAWGDGLEELERGPAEAAKERDHDDQDHDFEDTNRMHVHFGERIGNDDQAGDDRALKRESDQRLVVGAGDVGNDAVEGAVARIKLEVLDRGRSGRARFRLL